MGTVIGIVGLLVLLGVGAGVVWQLRGQLSDARHERGVAEMLTRELTGRARYLEEQLRAARRLEREVAAARDGRADRSVLDRLYAGLAGGAGADRVPADGDGAAGADAAAGEADSPAA